MNKYGHSEAEDLIFSALKKQYGMTWEALDESVVQEKIDSCKNLYELAVDEFRLNQSAYNYNLLITAMVSLQYWNQKRVKLFTTTEEF